MIKCFDWNIITQFLFAVIVFIYAQGANHKYSP